MPELGCELTFSDAELTLLARMAGTAIFPATPPPELDDDGWKAVGRGLVARGIVHGTLRRRVEDEVAAVLDVVMFAERSLWMQLDYQPGGDENVAEALWLRGDHAVRHSCTSDEIHHLRGADMSAVDEFEAMALDLRTATGSQDGEPVTMSGADYGAAVRLGAAEGLPAVASAYPSAAGFIASLLVGRRTTMVEYQRGAPAAVVERRAILLSESPGTLWLMRDEPWTNPPQDDSGSIVLQQITVERGRALVTELVDSARFMPELGRSTR